MRGPSGAVDNLSFSVEPGRITGFLGPNGAAMAANRTKDTTFLGARYRRLAPRIGKLKALVAIEHSILTAVWHVLSENTDYHDLGGDYHAKRDPQRALRRLTRDANRLGYTVRFDPIQAA
jgi:transposase